MSCNDIWFDHGRWWYVVVIEKKRWWLYSVSNFIFLCIEPMQTTAQNTKAIRFGSGVLKIDNVNVGLLDNARMTLAYSIAQIKAHNGVLPIKKKIDTAEITAELYEVDLDNIAKIDSHGVLVNTPATAVNVTDEDLGTGLTANTPVALANANGNGAIVTGVTLTAGGTTVTASNYELFVKGGVCYLLPTANQTGAILIDYTYTPNTKQTITFSDIAKLVAYYEVSFVNTDENGKEFSITIPKAYSGEGLDFGFVSDDAVDETMKVPVKFTAFPDDNNVMIRIEDEQAV